MAKRFTVVVSQGQSNNPVKRQLEETVVAQLMMADGIDVLVVPHLYDLTPDSSAMVALQNLRGDFALLSWLYARAAHWILDRHDIRGQLGETAFKSAWDQRKKKWEKQTKEYRPDENTPRVLDQRPVPDRKIYHIDLRMEEDAEAFVKETLRLAAEQQTQVVSLDGGINGTQRAAPPQTQAQEAEPTEVQQKSPRRWYPVIDYSRCTNCMECIDFCLFGVYGVDYGETILVEQPDNCRKGCPACSRVCPENAIIFPQHKTPAIAGDPNIGSEMKIDLSQLFGKPKDHDIAARERDEQLRLAGLAPASATSTNPSAAQPDRQEKDELDELIDQLDEMDL